MMQVKIGATTLVEVADVGAQVLMLKGSLKRRAQGHAPRPSLTSLLRKSQEEEKEKAKAIVSYVGIILRVHGVW